MRKTLKASASGFYRWQDRHMCKRQKANVTLLTQIQEAFVAKDDTNCMPRIRAELMHAGMRCGQPQTQPLRHH